MSQKFATYVMLDSAVLKLAQGHHTRAESILTALAARDIRGLEDEEIGRMLAQIAQALPDKPHSIELCLPRHFAIVRNADLPSDNEAEIRELASFQAVKQTPYSLEEIVLDVEVLEKFPEYSRVRMVVVQRNAVDRLLRIAETAGLNVAAVRLASQCFEATLACYLNNHAKVNKNKEPIGLVSSEAAHMHVLLLTPGKGAYSRSVAVEREAHSFVQKLASELELSHAAYHRENPGMKVHKWYFEPSTGDLPKLTDFELTPMNAMTLINKSPSIAMDVPHGMKICYGDILGGILAPEMLTLNLLPQEIRQQRQSLTRRRNLIQTAVLGTIFLALCLAYFGEKVADKKMYLSQLATRLKSVEANVQTLEEQNNKITATRAMARDRGEVTRVITELYRLFPDTVFLSALSYERGHTVVIKGTAQDLSAVFDLIPALEKSDHFENVTSQYASKKRVGEKEIADFQLQCVISKVPS